MGAHSFLISIGATDMTSFKNKLITGGVVVIVVLLIVFIISRLLSRLKFKTEATAGETKDGSQEFASYKEQLVTLKKKLEVVGKEKLNEGAVFSLVLLQREGRLIDFLQENIETFDDNQIGAAVRQIHAGCSKVLTENFNVKSLFNEAEGESVSLDDNFDPSETRMTGNVPDQPPYKGILRHKGWAVGKVDLPTRTGEINDKVICPAEIEF